MSLMDMLTAKAMPWGTLIGGPLSVKPASVYISFPDVPELRHLYKPPFERIGAEQNKQLTFKLPVTPETIKISMGSEVDTNPVVQTGEVVLPKYKKSIQLRFDSFFPYDTNAPYVTTKSIKDIFKANTKSSLRRELKQTWRDYLDTAEPALPKDYIDLFKVVDKKRIPITIAVTFYEGGDIEPITMTVDTFDAEPESNGDYKYSMSLIEWTDIRPKLAGQVDSERTGAQILSDRLVSPLQMARDDVKDWWSFCKYWYGTASWKIIQALTTYNKVKNTAVNISLQAVKVKGNLINFPGKFGITSNLLGVTKITPSDTKAVSASIKSIDTSRSSKSTADLIAQRKSQNLTNG